MPTDRYDDDRYDDDRYESRRRSDPAAARRKVAGPAIVLILFGLLGIVIECGALGAALGNPTWFADWYKGVIDAQPPGKAKEDLQQQFKQQEAQLRMDSPVNIGSCVLGLVINSVMFLGGLKMRSLSGYPIALAGAICGIVPIGGCSCCAMPIGIWALIVLMNADVKAAFGGAGASTRRDDEDDDRWGAGDRGGRE